MPRNRVKKLRRCVYLVLEHGPAGDRTSVPIDRLLVALILINLIELALESAPSIDAQYLLVFELI